MVMRTKRKKQKTVFSNIPEMLWYTFNGYRGKSRKWARRRSKFAVRLTDSMALNPSNVKQWRRRAGVKDGR